MLYLHRIFDQQFRNGDFDLNFAQAVCWTANDGNGLFGGIIDTRSNPIDLWTYKNDSE